MEILINAVYGAFAGAVYAASGFLKNKEKKGVKFDPKRFLKTVAVAAFFGGGATFLGMSSESFKAIPFAGAITPVIEHLIEILFAKFKK